MIEFTTIEQLKNHLANFRGSRIGFVPTMGALHKGHISLIERAKAENSVVVCSIFVNPTQFNDLSDLEKYPRTIENDRKMLQDAGCDILFIPEIAEMYTPQEMELKRLKIEDKSWTKGKTIDFGELDKVMEGAQRPGHFNGVAQVVSKLFRIVEPDKAYFGQKDFQQLAIIRSMVKQLEMPVEIISCPIIRESDGLAMSSRNVRLSSEERKAAPLISKVLFKVQELQNTHSMEDLKTFVKTQIQAESLMALEYFEIVDAETLLPINDYNQAKSVVACIAIKLGAVRLIDNVLLY